MGHNVSALFLTRGRPDWFKIDDRVKIVYNPYHVSNIDVLVITSPHSIHLTREIRAKRTFIFCQMAEHMFQPRNTSWQLACRSFYTASYPMISISKWNISLFQNEYGRMHPTYYVGNGVNFDHFPISDKPKDGQCILVEGWECTNPSKDADHIGPKVALRLKEEFGVRILAYSQLPNKGPYYPDEYYMCPDIKKMNELYSRASFMIKASKYDARSCAPLEAMTKGTPTVRAIIMGDDDLEHGVNSLKVHYNEEELYGAAKAMLTGQMWKTLGPDCLNYVKTQTWEYWMKRIEYIYSCRD